MIPSSLIVASATIFPEITNVFNPSGGAGQGTAPFRTSVTDIWIPLYNQISGLVVMYHSSDNGATWVTEDAGNGPTENGHLYGAGCWWDGSQYLWSVDMILTGSIQLKKFDTVTKTWSAPFATGGPIVLSWYGPLFIRSNGDVVLLVINETGSPFRGIANILSGGSWSTIDWDTNQGSCNTMVGCIDGNDIIHILGASSTGDLFYQQLKPDNTLGEYIDLTSNGFLANGHQFESISVVGTQVIISTLANAPLSQPAILVGTIGSLGTMAGWQVIAAIDTPPGTAVASTVSATSAHRVICWMNFDGANFSLPRLIVDSGSQDIDPGSLAGSSIDFACLRVTSIEVLGMFAGAGLGGAPSDIRFFSFPFPVIPSSGCCAVSCCCQPHNCLCAL